MVQDGSPRRHRVTETETRDLQSVLPTKIGIQAMHKIRNTVQARQMENRQCHDLVGLHVVVTSHMIHTLTVFSQPHRSRKKP